MQLKKTIVIEGQFNLDFIPKSEHQADHEALLMSMLQPPTILSFTDEISTLHEKLILRSTPTINGLTSLCQE